LLEFNLFDTIYHEHFSYLSLYTVGKILNAAGLRIWNVEELSTHGGSLRIFGCHLDDVRQPLPIVDTILKNEKNYGLQELKIYNGFQTKVDSIKNNFVSFLIEKKKLGKKVVAYGAAAKGNTLLNYAGVKPDLIKFVCDKASSKQNKFLPGSHIPIYNPKMLYEDSPDYVVIFPWNIADEILQQNKKLKEAGVDFLIFIPELLKL
jgi:hypothetical protein